jgi:hypothetical protein
VQSNIENLSRRSRLLIFTTLSLSSQCSLEQVQCVIVKVREMLYSHTRVEQESAGGWRNWRAMRLSLSLIQCPIRTAAIQDIFFRMPRSRNWWEKVGGSGTSELA